MAYIRATAVLVGKVSVDCVYHWLGHVGFQTIYIPGLSEAKVDSP